METYNVQLMDLPPSIKGFARNNPDGSYTIILNSRLNLETQRKSMEHELEHIKRGDFYSGLVADQIEKERHK